MPEPAEIRNTPQNEPLGRIAELLKYLKGIAGSMAEVETPTSGPIQAVGALAKMLLGNKPELAEDLSYGAGPLQGSGMTTGPKEKYREDIADVLPQQTMMKGLKGLASALAGAGGIGAIRPRGRPDLILTHGTSPESLVTNEGPLRELYSPSLAITGHSAEENPFNYGALLVPKLGKFDPAYGGSTLFNRDAYLARAMDYPGHRAQRTGRAPVVIAEKRLADRSMDAKPFSESIKDWVDKGWEHSNLGPHSLVVDASPKFRSFQDYEKSASGAKVLVRKADEPLAHEGSGRLSDDFVAWWKDRFGQQYQGEPWVKYLDRAARSGDEVAVDILKRASRNPSNYAELKVHGPVPITGEHWAGAILEPKADWQGNPLAWFSRLTREFENRGLRIQTMERDPMERFKQIQMMQEAAGPTTARRTRDAPWRGPLEYNPRPVFPPKDTSPVVKPAAEKASSIVEQYQEGLLWPEEVLGQLQQKALFHQTMTPNETALYNNLMAQVMQKSQKEGVNFGDIFNNKMEGTEDLAKFSQELKALDVWGVHAAADADTAAKKASHAVSKEKVVDAIHPPPKTSATIVFEDPVLYVAAKKNWENKDPSFIYHDGDKYWVHPNGQVYLMTEDNQPIKFGDFTKEHLWEPKETSPTLLGHGLKPADDISEAYKGGLLTAEDALKAILKKQKVYGSGTLTAGEWGDKKALTDYLWDKLPNPTFSASAENVLKKKGVEPDTQAIKHKAQSTLFAWHYDEAEDTYFTIGGHKFWVSPQDGWVAVLQ